MSIKYSCDSCDKEMSLDQSPPQVDGGMGWSAFMHDQGIETAWYDKLTDERTYDHQCKSCHIKEQGEESYYEENEQEKYIIENGSRASEEFHAILNKPFREDKEWRDWNKARLSRKKNG